MEEWLLVLAFLPLAVFYIVFKIVRIRMYAYRAKHHREEYRHFGYRALGAGFVRDIFSRRDSHDRRYQRMLADLRVLAVLLLLMLAATIFVVFAYLK